MLTHKAEPEPGSQDGDADTNGTSTRRHRRWLAPAFLVVAALLLAAVVWIGYAWTQTRYYVGSYDNQVTIYNGVSQTVGPIRLSHVAEVSDIPVDSLSEYHRNRVQDTLPARDLVHAEQIVEELRATAKAVLCPPGSTGTPSASPTATPDPGTSPSPSPSASPSAPSDAAAVPEQCGGQL